MLGRWLALALLLLPGLTAPAWADPPPTPTVPSAQGTYLGLLFVPAPSGQGLFSLGGGVSS